MIIGFKERFKDKIFSKKKIHTIRDDSKNRWISGLNMHMATGVRTKKYNQFAIYTCQSIQSIEIIRVNDYLNETIIKVDGRKLSDSEIQQLAWNDGFENMVDFWLWFKGGFVGKLIHWTDFKY